MNPQKAELKLSILSSMGNDLDDDREGVEKNVRECDGAHQAFKDAIVKMGGILALYQKKLVDEEDAEYTPEVHGFVAKAIQRCIGMVENLGDMTQARKTSKQGELNALNRNIDRVKKQYDAQRTQLENFMDALNDPDISEEQKKELLEGRPPLQVVGGKADAAADLKERKLVSQLAKAEVQLEEALAADPEGDAVKELTDKIVQLRMLLPGNEAIEVEETQEKIVEEPKEDPAPVEAAPVVKAATPKKTKKKKRKRSILRRKG